MNKPGKVALGAGIAVVGVGGAILAVRYAQGSGSAASTTGTSGAGSGGSSGTGGGTDASPAVPGLSIGQPYVTQFAQRVTHGSLRRPGPRVNYMGTPLVAAVGGLASVASVTAQDGQILNVPITVENVGPTTLYFAASGFTWEGGGATGSSTVAIPGLGTVPIGGHLTEANGSSSAATGSAAPGGSWSPTLQSEGALGYTGFPVGAYVSLSVYEDAAMTQPVSGSPVAAWTDPFLTVALPGLSSLIQFGIGSPSVGRVAVGGVR